MHDVTLLFAEVDPRAAGQTVGKVIAVAILAAGAAKCFAISRRPTTNAKCALSLMFLLLGWGVSSALTLIPGLSAAVPAIMVLSGLLTVSLIVVAIVLAVLGLVEYSAKRDLYIQGRAQAIWTLALCALFLTFFTIGLLRARKNPVATRAQPSAGQTLSFPELNYQLLAPGKPWVQVDAAKLNRFAKVGFMRSNPTMMFLIIAEELGEANIDTAALVEVATGNLRSAADSARISRKDRSRVGRLDGVLMESDVELRALKISYVHWICATNGWAYQLIFWGPQPDKARLLAESKRLTGQFSLIDYDRHASGHGAAPEADFVSTNFQFRVRWAGSEWRPWQSQAKDLAGASFGALHIDDAALAVSAVSLTDLEPHPEAIYHAFADALGVSLSETTAADRREITQGGFSGIETQVKKKTQNGEEYTYRLRILHGGGVAYGVAAWVQSSERRRDEILTDALARVILPEVPPSPVLSWRLTEAEKRARRIFANGAGMYYFEAGQFDQSARLFKAAFDLDGDRSDTPYLSNLVQAWSRAGKYREALDVLDSHARLVETRPDLQANRAFFQAELGQTDQALTNYAKLFTTGYREEGHFKQYIEMLSEAGHSDRALAEVEKFLEARDTTDIRLLQASLLKLLKKPDQAIILLQAQRQKNPFHAGVARSLADAFIQAQRHSDALALADEQLKGQGDDASFLYLKGRAEYGLKWYRPAKESFERAAKKAPNDPDIRSFLDHTSGLLGEGANTAIKDPIAPVPVPGALLDLWPAPPADYARDYGAYYARRLTAVSFVKGKEMKTTDYVTVRTVNAAGVSAFSTIQLMFDPLSEELFVNHLEVKAPDGTLVSTGRVADFYLLDDRSSESVSHHKVLHMPISGLQPGYSLEFVTTRRELGKHEEFPLLAHTFSRPFPAREAVLFLRGETGAVRYAASPKIEPECLPEGLCWRVKDPVVFRPEPMQAVPVDYLPAVWLSDKAASWISETTNYLGAIRDHLELPPAQRDLARQLTAGATNDVQKITAITGYLQSNFTYKAIEFGRRARIPQRTADIIRNKYGDCKDHALLAQQMLAGVGIPASLALVSFNAPVRQDLPSLDQFDHMIVHLPGPEGGRFLDCTDKMGRPFPPVPLGLGGREALILSDSAPRFVRIPDYPTDASVIRLGRTVQLTNQTDAFVEETLTLNGTHGAWLREYLRHLTPAVRRSYLTSLLKSRGAELLSLGLDNLEQTQLPLVMTVVYTLRSQFHATGSQLSGNAPACFEHTYLAAEPVEKRLSPFQIGIPFTLETTVTVRAPEGFLAKSAEPAERKWDGRFVRGQVVATAEKTGWRLSCKLFQPAGRFSAGDYTAFCAALDRASSDLTPKLTFERVGQ